MANPVHVFVEYKDSIPNSFPKKPIGISKYMYICRDCLGRLRFSEKFVVMREVSLSRETRRDAARSKSGMPEECQNPGCKGPMVPGAAGGAGAPPGGSRNAAKGKNHK